MQGKDDLIASHQRIVAELMDKISGLEESNRRLVLAVSNPSSQFPQLANASLDYKDTAAELDKRACAMQKERDSEILELKTQVTSLIASLRDSKSSTINQVAILESRKKKLLGDKNLLSAKVEKEKMLESRKLVAEWEGYQHRAVEIGVVNAQLALDLDFAKYLVKLLTTNEVLFQKLIELGTDAIGLEIKTARLTDEIVLLRKSLREYEEEKELEEAVLNLDNEDQSSTEVISNEHSDSFTSSIASATSDFIFVCAEESSSSLEVVSSSAGCDNGAEKQTFGWQYHSVER
ncbi:uncharacterized protein BT62DRAFT_920828 [Guyanagaster necrorhizus]|uniref:Uncharacterized protein n=1 Tax=Guyanagaster necrorhizus TaxID=856835 RepID=A0A9P7VPM2_9AGAR|nr:uncharacterized protein BT62DRAFT_920828 [Guyanagaster necrorhizus MCA 3950]KAG7445078.1 hypothetical protein BT62DRAFT_920828 [Guyanagaster necrorhizus MCA 3950]